MIGHSLARDEPTRWQVDLGSTACVLAASEWEAWYRSIGKACVLLASENVTNYPHASCVLLVWNNHNADMPTSGNTNLYFEAHKPVFFNKNLYFLKTYTNRLPLPHFITRIFITTAWRLYEVPAARILLLESLFSFIFGRHHTYKLYKISW